jgi:hypothetical protein
LGSGITARHFTIIAVRIIVVDNTPVVIVLLLGVENVNIWHGGRGFLFRLVFGEIEERVIAS